MKASFHEIAGAIKQAHRIAILSHVRPDCDAIGSQLALALSLQQLGKEVSAWNEDGLPGSFRFLGKSELIHQPPSEPEEFDLAIALDTASQQRLGTGLQAIGHATRWINIDHHLSNPGYGDLVYIDVVAPATGQIVYEFLRAENFPLTLDAADALYAAISTDTGSFRYANTTARTFKRLPPNSLRRGSTPRQLPINCTRAIRNEESNSSEKFYQRPPSTRTTRSRALFSPTKPSSDWKFNLMISMA